MDILVSGSLAYDRIMDYSGRFAFCLEGFDVPRLAGWRELLCESKVHVVKPFPFNTQPSLVFVGPFDYEFNLV